MTDTILTAQELGKILYVSTSTILDRFEAGEDQERVRVELCRPHLADDDALEDMRKAA